ncbi:tetratricopeptide repeat protein [Streptomyces sp. AN091965]|uniref:tetratricopeptide repeat protein n=1 Tax=Streptomyces sp. AN091965 TaxID=2927803 RepID=UPI001F61AB35|nr:tetratricopeptide repeat protein [Streptomyces sp. AN091965]MCI3932754.1 tetratricopeptide repeat protein [Streptomyces sp. AN091965]
MGGWVPDARGPFPGPRREQDLPRELRSFLREHGAPALLELHGPQPLHTSAYAARLARFARDAPSRWRSDPVWLAVGPTDVAAPERLLLRLLEQTLEENPPWGGPADGLPHFRAAGPERLPEALSALCHARLTRHRWTVVLDGVPDGEPGDELLLLAEQLVLNTEARVVAVSQRPHDGTGERWVRSAVAATAPDVPGKMLTHAALKLLIAVEPWEGDEFDATVAGALCADTRMTDRLRDAALRELTAHGLLQQTRPGWYRRTGSRFEHGGAAKDRALASAVLDGTADPRRGVDAYLDLAVRLLRRDDPEGPALLERLEPQLITQQGLFRLLRAKQTLWRATGEWKPLCVTAAVAIRETGAPQQALDALERLSAPRAVREIAVTLRHLGELPFAIGALDALEASEPGPRTAPDGWVLHTRAAIQCDQGRLKGADRLLRRAVEAHQVRGDVRGEAWAVHHYGRLRLLRGDVEEARKVLEDARNRFTGLGDLQGEAWTTTELGKAALVHDDFPAAVEMLSEAAGRHHANGDVRGRCWTELYLGIAHAVSGGLAEAVLKLDQACRGFSGVRDLLGRAWADHCLGALPAYTAADRLAAAAELDAALTGFRRAACPHGDAWTLLEQSTQRSYEGHATHVVRDQALRLFESIDDPSGARWGAGWEELGAGPGRIPLTARLTVPEPDADFEHATLSPATHARVRLTLLDDRSTAGTASRIMLRIQPGAEHAWSDRSSGLPWLTVRATPLTGADVEPAHAVTLRPSPRAADAAEFLFTPRRAGRHRLLFTVEHLETATVLQEVETYIDVVESDGEEPRSGHAPQALRRS